MKLKGKTEKMERSEHTRMLHKYRNTQTFGKKGSAGHQIAPTRTLKKKIEIKKKPKRSGNSKDCELEHKNYISVERKRNIRSTNFSQLEHRKFSKLKEKNHLKKATQGDYTHRDFGKKRKYQE